MKSETAASLSPNRTSALGAHIPAIAAGSMLLVAGLSAIPALASVLPVLSLSLFTLAFVEFVIARTVGTAGAVHADLMGAFVLVGGAAAMLSESQHIVDLFGLAMPA